MAIVYEAPVSPDDLTVFTRNVPLMQNLVLNRLLPDRTVNSNRVDFGTLTKNGRTAQFRVFDGPIHVSKRDTFTSQSVGLPPLSDSIGMGEYERLQLEFARTQGGNTAALVNSIYDDATILTQNVLRRMELARGDALQDGKFTLAGEGGLTMEADFSSGMLTYTAGTLWSTVATADAIANLGTWVQAYIDQNGAPPGGMCLSRQTVSYMLQNAGIRQLAGNLIGTPTGVARTQLDAVLDNYMLPPISMIYDSSVLDPVTGSSVRVLPQNKIIFLPPDGQTIGYTAWGVTATALELTSSSESDLSFQQAAGIVGVVEKQGPPYRQYVFVDAVGMPVIENPNLLMVATVS